MAVYSNIGVIGTSRKENEKRVAIHPAHMERIPLELRERITFETGYGLPFGMTDNTLAELSSGRVASREEILGNFECLLLPKPLAEDLSQVKEGTTVWGWPHCAQQRENTQVAIDRKLTLIAWEEMFTWSPSGDKDMHIFYKNNEIAGYAGVNHALSLVGIAGNYGEPRKAAVLSFGSVSRGAVYALQGQGFQDITVYTNRISTNVREQLPAIVFKQMINDADGNLLAVESDGTTKPFSDELADVQIIVNGMFQDLDAPIMIVPESEAHKLMNGTLIIDISCDEGMGFWCAKPTSFDHPMFETDGKFYYAVDHSPSYYWDSASWEISEALIPFLHVVLGGPDAWKRNETIAAAIEIRDGVVQNPGILSFQNREQEYPHRPK